jgi:hypothetical protein
MKKILITLLLIILLSGCVKQKLQITTTTISTTIQPTTVITTTTIISHNETENETLNKTTNNTEIQVNTNISIRAMPWGGQKLDDFKKIGVNYLQIIYWIEVDRNGSVLSDEATLSPKEASIIKMIEEAHDAGFKIWLQLYPEFYSTQGKHGGDPSIGLPSELELGPVKDIEKFKQQMIDKVKHWAKIAQENNVELFSPTCELIIFFPRDHSSSSFYPVLADVIKSVYSGPIVPKAEITWQKYNINPENDISFFNFTGYDYVTADLFGNRGEGVTSLDDYRGYIRNILNTLEEMKSKYGAKGIIFSEIGTPDDCEQTDSRCIYNLNSSKEQIYAATTQIIFEETEGKVNGYSFWGVTQCKGDTSAHPAAIEVIKKFYLNHN